MDIWLITVEVDECLFLYKVLLGCGLKNGSGWLRHFSEIYDFTRLLTVDKGTDFSYLLVHRYLSPNLQSWIAFIPELYTTDTQDSCQERRKGNCF